MSSQIPFQSMYHHAGIRSFEIEEIMKSLLTFYMHHIYSLVGKTSNNYRDFCFVCITAASIDDHLSYHIINLKSAFTPPGDVSDTLVRYN